MTIHRYLTTSTLYIATNKNLQLHPKIFISIQIQNILSNIRNNTYSAIHFKQTRDFKSLSNISRKSEKQKEATYLSFLLETS